MLPEHLFADEKIINQSKKIAVVLTNYRIRHFKKKLGNMQLTSIFLNKISAIEIQYKSYPFIIVLAVFLCLMNVYLMHEKNQTASFLGFVLGGVLVLLFLFTRRHVITITSSGKTKINFRTKGMGSGAVLNFVNSIEEAMKNSHENSKEG